MIKKLKTFLVLDFEMKNNYYNLFIIFYGNERKENLSFWVLNDGRTFN